MERQLLRLLIIDDSPDDAEQTIDLLRKAGYMLKSQRIQDAAGLHAEIGKGGWDVIVCEGTLGHFKTESALDMLKRAGVDLPFIVLARRISETDAVRLMRAGAQDVLVKSSALRLPAVIERELSALMQRQHSRRAEQALHEIEHKHRALIEISREAICYVQDGMHLDANGAYLALFGYREIADLDGIPFLNLVAKTDAAKVKDFLRKATQKPTTEPCAFIAVSPEGNRFHAELSISPLTIKGEPCQQLIVADVSKRKAAEQKLLYLNQHDALTGLHNRQFFLQELAKAVEAARTGAQPSMMLYIDIDQLQAINDEFGFDTGDRLLLRLAKLFRDKVRPQDVLARLSGDEFGALMLGADRAAAEAAANQINKTLKSAPLTDNGRTRECQCTVSVVDIGADTPSTHKVLMTAHQLQAQAKGAVAGATVGGAPAVPYNEWHKRIEAALASGKFHIVFQPIVNLHADASENYEVLVRMTAEDNAVVSAGEFMSAAEESGQARHIDRAVAEQVVASLRASVASGKHLRFFLNVSHWTVRDAEFIPYVTERLAAAGLAGHYLNFEIDESTLLKYPAETSQFVRAARKLGADLTVDNFTMASMQYLRNEPINFIKISGSLIQNIANDALNQNVVQTISRLAKSLERRTVAKYVESAETLSILWTYEIDYVQGHYFQAPHAALAYDFAMESLSSDHAVAGWVPTH